MGEKRFNDDTVTWTRRLSVRLTGVTLLVVAPSLGVLAVLGLRAQERHVVDEAVRAAALLSDTVKNSTHLDMLADRRPHAYSIMRSIARQEGIERVRIFNKEGLITFSTSDTERGTVVDKQAESCYACHAADQPLVRLAIPSRSRIYQTNAHRVVGMVTPIYNEPSCSDAACHAHPADKRVLGVVDVGVSLADSDASLSRLRRRTYWAALIAVTALAAGMASFARRLVVEPVERLVEGTRRIASGDLTYRIPQGRQDELGQLAASFNGMTQSLLEVGRERDALLEGLERKVEERTAALRKTQSQLVQAEKLASLGRLAASIAHEINNPLAGILTFARLQIRSLEEETGLDPKLRERHVEQLRLVQRETERCTAIVRNLLDFARQRPLKLTRFALGDVVDEAMSLVGHQLRLKSVEVVWDGGEAPAVRADFGQIRQSLVNLLLNAADAMPSGGEIHVSLAPSEDGGEAVLTVTDTGVGIAPEDMEKILDPFFSTKDKGTGLGLSVVYGIVERHGGRLEIESEPGRGTRVRVRLPSADASDAEAKTPSEVSEAAPGSEAADATPEARG